MILALIPSSCILTAHGQRFMIVNSKDEIQAYLGQLLSSITCCVTFIFLKNLISSKQCYAHTQCSLTSCHSYNFFNTRGLKTLIAKRNLCRARDQDKLWKLTYAFLRRKDVHKNCSLVKRSSLINELLIS